MPGAGDDGGAVLPAPLHLGEEAVIGALEGLLILVDEGALGDNAHLDRQVRPGGEHGKAGLVAEAHTVVVVDPVHAVDLHGGGIGMGFAIHNAVVIGNDGLGSYEIIAGVLAVMAVLDDGKTLVVDLRQDVHMQVMGLQCLRKGFTEIAKRQAAYLPHGSLTPTVVLTEPPNAVTRSRREYHYHSGCHGRAGGIPTLIAGFLAHRIAGHGVPDYRGSCFHTSPELKS